MTREDKLYSMKGSELIKEADKLGVKVNCNKSRTQLTEAKSKVVERILAAEAAMTADTEETPVVEEVQVEETPVETPVIEETQEQVEEPKVEKTKEEIPPFVYTDVFGEEWEDADIAEMIYKWSDEKKSAFRTWFDKLVSDVEVDLSALDYMCETWSTRWDVKHGTSKEKKEGHAPTPKRGALIEWNGKAQNICKWGEELGISPNTLYGRIYKMGWTVERAFTTKPR